MFYQFLLGERILVEKEERKFLIASLGWCTMRRLMDVREK